MPQGTLRITTFQLFAESLLAPNLVPPLILYIAVLLLIQRLKIWDGVYWGYRESAWRKRMISLWRVWISWLIMPGEKI